MRVVKFCNKSHNPLFSECMIQICTVYYYKSTDNDFIRDVDEGLISRVFHPPTPAVFTGNDVGRMTGLPITGTGIIRVAGRAIRTTRHIPNAYVFCMSHLDAPTLEHAAFFGYDSWYIIKDAGAFCALVAHEIMRQLAAPDIIAFHGEVSYQENKEVTYSALSDYFRGHHIIDPRFYLMKRERPRENVLKMYALEREYRFVFIPVGKDRRLIPLKKDKIYLESECILSSIADTNRP